MQQYGIVHPTLAINLPGLFKSTITIQAYTATQADNGEEIKTWADFGGIVAIQARVSPMGGRETRTTAMIYTTATHVVTLMDNYTTITPKMRVVCDDGTIYNIVAVLIDDNNIFTKLVCEIVT
jgi:head-tail adaptor